MRHIIAAVGVGIALLLAVVAVSEPIVWIGFALWLPILWLIGRDYLQSENNVRRVFPLFGTLNDVIHRQRHVPQELLLQRSWEGRPFSILQRRIVQKRAEETLQNSPFGSELDYSSPEHTWLAHSLYPSRLDSSDWRTTIGGPRCQRPYAASLFNIAAMSFGAISANAVRALGEGARSGGFALNTGEGGLTDHHLETGADLIWQLGTAYFGARTSDGRFDPDSFREKAVHPNVKMIEIKISQGAKPGFGAILPAKKNTREVASYREVEPGTEIRSPGHHPEFSTSEGMLDFINQLRELSDGKPIGIKLCLGDPKEFVELCRLISETDRGPDYISIDGGEGGTGAASVESIHHVGAPGEPSLRFVHETLVDYGIRDRINLEYAGKVISGFDIARHLASGADRCSSARGMMFALGCVQSLKCNTNQCPTGITSMKKSRTDGLVPKSKGPMAAAYHRNTLEGLKELLEARGLEGPDDLGPEHIRVGSRF